MTRRPARTVEEACAEWSVLLGPPLPMRRRRTEEAAAAPIVPPNGAEAAETSSRAAQALPAPRSAARRAGQASEEG
jgi:hypothetical protein